MEFYRSSRVVALLSLAVLLLLIFFFYFSLTGYSILGGDSSSGSVHLFWSDSSSNEDGFSVERSDFTPSSFFEIGNVSEDVVLYVDSAVIDGETYFYRVRAFNVNGFSAYSNVVNVTVPLNGSNVSTSVPSSGGGGGGGSSGSSSGGVTGNSVAPVVENPSVESGNSEPDPSAGSSDSRPIGSDLISGQAIREDLNEGNISKIGIIVLVFVAVIFILYKAVYYSITKIFSSAKASSTAYR